MRITPKIDGGCVRGVVHRQRVYLDLEADSLETAVVPEKCTWCAGRGCVQMELEPKSRMDEDGD